MRNSAIIGSSVVVKGLGRGRQTGSAPVYVLVTRCLGEHMLMRSEKSAVAGILPSRARKFCPLDVELDVRVVKSNNLGVLVSAFPWPS